MKKPIIKEFPTPEVPLELIHHDDLGVTFESLKIEVSPSPLGFDARIIYKLRGIKVADTIKIAREIANLPENKDKDFDIIHSYLRRVTVYLPKHEMDIVYDDNFAYAGYANEHFMGTWRSEYVGTSHTTLYGGIVNPQGDENVLEGTIFINAFKASSKEELIMAVNGFGYFLLQQGIGVHLIDEKKRRAGVPKFYTNASEEKVEMPNFGFVPRGLQYIDFTDWNGEPREYTQADLNNTDDLK